jgi:hypothetical protein
MSSRTAWSMRPIFAVDASQLARRAFPLTIDSQTESALRRRLATVRCGDARGTVDTRSGRGDV